MAEIKRRAVSNEQKEKRRQDILDSARALLASTNDYSTLLMKHIAENIGLTKGTLYLYFKTKEEVFIALYTQELNQCFKIMEKELGALQTPSSTRDVADTISDVLIQQPMFIKLTSMLHGVLEQNIEFDTALAFKTRLRDHLLNAAKFVQRCLPELGENKGIEMFFSSQALLIGYYHAALPSPATEKILERPDMAFMQVDFVSEFKVAMRRMLFAIAEESKAGK